MAISKDCSFLPLPRILTRGRILFSVLTVFVLTVFVNAQDTVFRYAAGSSTSNASGTDIYTVQTKSGAADGDVIKISSGTLTNSSGVSLNDTYLVRTFTVESADGNKKTVPATTDSTYYRNYLLAASGATYNLTFNNLDFQGTGTAIAHWGLFLHESKGNANLTINLNNVSFTQFKGNDSNGYGGVIESKSPATINGSNVSFTQNEGTSGGAIHIESGNLTVNIGGNLSFESNKAIGTHSENREHDGDGGAIYSTGNVSLTNAQKISFVNNSSKGSAGAISFTGVCTIEADEIIFEGNHADYHGGAILGNSGTSVLNIKGGNIRFTGNYNEGSNPNPTDGGAIRLESGGTVNISGQDSESVIDFSNNISKVRGGAIRATTTNISTGSFTFKNNSAGTYGGAILSATITFSGDNTSAVFTNNTAVSGGNDFNVTGKSGTVLSFTGSGTYYFDGGIRIADILSEDTSVNTDINQAQVTIAGRQYKPVANENDPLVEDHTNNYQLRTVSISNGGSLTANLDYIDSLTGTFNVGTADTAGTLELNVSEDVVKKLNADSFKVVRTDKGEVVKTGDGTLQLCNEAQDMIDINSLVVSSGRMDILGYMTGGIKVEPDSVFSPGNSVGDARFGGGYELKEDATLLIEQDASGIDTLTATSFDIDSNSIIDFAADSLQPGASYDIIFQKDSAGNPINFTGAQATNDFWNNLLTPESAYYWNLSVSGNIVRASVDANAVPEPSTWALMILGAAGLLYVRKRNRK